MCTSGVDRERIGGLGGEGVVGAASVQRRGTGRVVWLEDGENCFTVGQVAGGMQFESGTSWWGGGLAGALTLLQPALALQGAACAYGVHPQQRNKKQETRNKKQETRNTGTTLCSVHACIIVSL